MTHYISLQTPRGRVTVARQAHNLKIAGSIPAPATRNSRFITQNRTPQTPCGTSE